MTDTNRRFVFQGTATAVSGHVHRPKESAGLIHSPAAAALSVAGGASRAESRKKRLTSWLTIGAATASAESRFADRKLAVEMSWHRVPAEAVSSTTHVAVSVTGLDIRLEDHRLSATALKASLTSASPPVGGYSTIRVGKDTDIKGFDIDGFPVRFVFDRERFEKNDSFEKMAKAVGAPVAGAPIFTSVVKEVVWGKKAHPKATIDGHMIHLPDVGRFYFGEIFIWPDARRLTLVRMALGSHLGGEAGIGDVHTDGSWYPP